MSIGQIIALVALGAISMAAAYALGRYRGYGDGVEDGRGQLQPQLDRFIKDYEDAGLRAPTERFSVPEDSNLGISWTGDPIDQRVTLPPGEAASWSDVGGVDRG